MAKPNATLTGTDEDDRLIGKNGNDTYFGALGNDVLHGGNGNDSLDGGDGDDELKGGNGKDTLIGGLGNDELDGGNGKDSLDGGDGDDELIGGNGVDTLAGGLGNDLLDGGRGGDRMDGGDGDDTYVVDSRPDRITELADQGIDTVETSLSKYTLGSNLENLAYTGSKNFSGTGNELNNTLTGGDGNDVLNGGAGDDILVGGLGNDILTGGDGADLFLLTALSGIDTIQDFTDGSDQIGLDVLTFTDLVNDGSGHLDPLLFVAGTEATTAEQRIVYDSASGNVMYDADGNGAAAPVTIAQVTAGLLLSSDDFTVI